MSTVAVIFSALCSISAMVTLVLFVAWYDFDRPRHALTWTIASALMPPLWLIELMQGGQALSRPGWAVAIVALGGAASALNTLGFRQRAHRGPHALLLLAAGLLPAALLALLGSRVPTELRLLPLDLCNAALLTFAATTLVGRRRGERTARRVTYIGLLGLAGASLLMGLVRVISVLGGRSDVAIEIGGIVLMLMPATITGIGLFAIFLLTADLADQTRRLAATDTLTGMLNRRAFVDYLAAPQRRADDRGTLAMLVLVPLIWGLLRRGQGLPMFGAPTVAELEGERRRPRRAQSASRE